MSQWIEVAKLADCPAGSACEVVVGDRMAALFNVDGELFAMDGVCAHQGGPLGKGCVEAGVVTCPWHGWQYDVRTGYHLTSQRVAQSRHRVRIEVDDGGIEKIWVSRDADESSTPAEQPRV